MRWPLEVHSPLFKWDLRIKIVTRVRDFRTFGPFMLQVQSRAMNVVGHRYCSSIHQPHAIHLRVTKQY